MTFRKSFHRALYCWLERDWKVRTQRRRLWPKTEAMPFARLVVFVFPVTEPPFWERAPGKGGKVPANQSVSRAGAWRNGEGPLSNHRAEPSLICQISWRLPNLPASIWGRFCSLSTGACLGADDLDQRILWSENGFKICWELPRAHFKHLNCRLHIFCICNLP